MAAISAARLWRRVFWGHRHWLWLSSAVEFLILVAWMVLDPRFHTAAFRLPQAACRLPLGADITPGDGSAIPLPALVLGVLLTLVVLTHTLWLGTLIGGSRKQRSLRAWLLFVTLVCVWTQLAMNWPQVTWWGKQYRLRREIGAFETVAKELRAQWPRDDGELASRDPFMAYPVGDPATLIMLTLPNTSDAGTSFSLVERGASGSLRFQLTGRESGDWLEWHPRNEKPSSFVGGLLDAHELEQFSDFGAGWYLVRYRP